MTAPLLSVQHLTVEYTVGGKTRFLSVSVQGGSNTKPLFAHGMAHQLNLVDLYPHENVTFPRPYADGWDNMALPFTGAHPLVWSKELASWASARDARIVFVPRPAPHAFAVAFKHALCAFRRDFPHWNHEFYWAPYVLHGLP